MKRWLLKKSLTFLFFLWAAGSLIFFLVHAIPGDPVVAMLGSMPAAADVQRLNKSLKLDRPLSEQYVRFISRLFLLDLGESFVDREPVAAVIMRYFPNTAILTCSAMLLSILVAFPLGVLAALKKNSVWSALSLMLSAIGLAVPSFLLGFLLIILFSVRLRLLPVSGSGGIQFLILPALDPGHFSQRLFNPHDSQRRGRRIEPALCLAGPGQGTV